MTTTNPTMIKSAAGFDVNGLALTPMGDTMNTYLYTAVLPKVRKYSAYANATPGGKQKIFGMQVIGIYDDPRDAAFVAQEFAALYDRHAVTEMVASGSFKEIADEFVENLDIPVWAYPAEGLSFEDLESDYTYTRNYVNTSVDALKEAIQVFSKKPPAVQKVKALVAEVETLVSTGKTYREAARHVVELRL